MSLNVSIFDSKNYIGTVTKVTPRSISANLPFSSAGNEERGLIKGIVGDFIFVECDRYGIFGRITEIHLPEKDRLNVEAELGKSLTAHPIGQVQLMATLDLATNQVRRGIGAYPRIGDRIFIAPKEAIEVMSISSEPSGSMKTLNIGRLSTTKLNINILPKQLFGRHCGVLGATGGGKSYTLAKIIEEIKERKGKAILLDPSGEFRGIDKIDRHLALGKSEYDEKLVYFSYRKMTENDLYVLFNPSPGIQLPKLREAIKSLKLVTALGYEASDNYQNNGLSITGKTLDKAGKEKAAFLKEIEKNTDRVYSEKCDFDIRQLATQIEKECVWDDDKSDPKKWGAVNESQKSSCSTLMSRINNVVYSDELQCVFNNKAGLQTELDSCIDDFAKNDDNIIRISLEHLSFQYNTRELVVNAIGAYLLRKARKGDFRNNNKPMVVLIDEAHQFINKKVGNDDSKFNLDAFGLIAKEGRKYGLTCVIATQRPRDIPEDVLSQLGTLIVHRLVNEKDIEVIKNACGELNKSATDFIPVLGEGEAILVGADFHMPIPLQIHMPQGEVKSKGPDFDKWG